jgi:spoIIIJ-associated protein
MGDAATIADLRDKVLDWAQGLAQASGLDVTAAVSREDAEGITVSFSGTDARLLIGRNGQVLDALQLLATNGFVRRGSPRVHLTFDADDYRARREQVLINLASELADQVLSTGQEAVLDPLSPMERRIVHRALTEIPGVRTYSEGEDPDRYIVIAPAG